MLIAQITDIHLGFEPDSPGEFNRQRLDRTLQALCTVSPRPDLLLLTGDLIDRGDVDSYLRLQEALDGFPIPFHLALGNHDDRDNFQKVFPQFPFTDGFLQYEIAADAVRLLVLDTLEVGRHGGGFCDVRAQWLNARLDEDGTTPTLIVLHHPPFESAIPWMTTVQEEPWVQRLSACLAGRPNVHTLICGHIHRASATLWKGLQVVTTPSTAPQVALELERIEPEEPDERPLIVADPPAYALHVWNGHDLVTHWDTAADRTVLARFDPNLQDMIRHMYEERPEGGPVGLPPSRD